MNTGNYPEIDQHLAQAAFQVGILLQDVPKGSPLRTDISRAYVLLRNIENRRNGRSIITEEDVALI